MGIEGQESPRDVASENEKHPWEFFPEGETSAGNGEKKREKKKNSKFGKFFGWVKTHLILSAGIIALIVALTVGGIFLVNHLKKTGVSTGDGGVNGTLIEAPEDMTLENLPSPEFAYVYMVKYFDPILEEGIMTSGQVDETKIEDNLAIYLKKVESESDKIFFRLYGYYKIASIGYGDRAEALLQVFDEENHELNRNQRYLYLLAYETTYFKTEDEEKHNEYMNLLDTEFPEDESYYDVDTGQVIVKEKEEEAENEK